MVGRWGEWEWQLCSDSTASMLAAAPSEEEKDKIKIMIQGKKLNREKEEGGKLHKKGVGNRNQELQSARAKCMYYRNVQIYPYLHKN